MPYQRTYIPQNPSPFTGKERDHETGYSYFGARYYDSDLSGLFLSVDPMSDKYPNLSPYAYCAWNPVKLVDNDGRKIKLYDDVTKMHVQQYINELFGSSNMFSFEKDQMTINKRQFRDFYKNASDEQRTLLNGLRELIDRPEIATIKVQENEENFTFSSSYLIGAITFKGVKSGCTSEKSVPVLGYMISINDKGECQNIQYSTNYYSLAGSIEDKLYPISTFTTASSTFIHETLDELLNRNILGNVAKDSPNEHKVKYQNVAQKILHQYPRNGEDHTY
ncbi:MAG: RHS repeat-associated core domain-containing protein [Bacteroidales bacterium]|nr:RHS repeat-associated core domain-containing protein [Bacteroidales bacterium]